MTDEIEGVGDPLTALVEHGETASGALIDIDDVEATTDSYVALPPFFDRGIGVRCTSGLQTQGKEVVYISHHGDSRGS